MNVTGAANGAGPCFATGPARGDPGPPPGEAGGFMRYWTMPRLKK
jgi:hypothetical protein